MHWCKKMQDSIPTELSLGQVEKLVEQELGGRKLSDVFEYFDPEPIGSASIGVVHRARLKSNGKEVVVKVQYPGIEHKFRADIKTLKAFCTIAMPHQVPFFEEIERQFIFEFDYRDEAKHLREIKSNLVMGGWGKKVIVPEPVTELCTRTMLVMEYIPGKKLIDGLRDQFRKVAERQGKTLEQMEDGQKRLIEEGKIQKKSVEQYSRQIKFYNLLTSISDFGANSLVFLNNYLLKPFTGKKMQYRYTPHLINMGEILDTLLKVHAHELFINGAFNGDPHPGNILLLPDGRLGLIDYGQVAHISPENRRTYAKLIIALNDDNKQEVVRIIRDEIGVKTKYSNSDILYRFAAFWNDRDTEDVTMGLNIQLFMEYLERTDPIVKVNEKFIMCGRISILLRGMGNAFGIRLRTSDYWRPYAEKALTLYTDNPKHK
jgi:aarF domain-containing kinase